MSPESALAAYKQRADTELSRYFDAKIAESAQVSPSAEAISRNIAEFTLRGGKRFRSALFYYGYRLFGGKDEEEVVRTSIFMELIQSYLLMHDDIMDRSPLRRGGPTMHIVYEEFSRQHGFQDDLHFGQAMATLAGDIANQYALEIVSQSAFPAEEKIKLLDLVAREVNTVCIGQMHDILLGYGYPPAYEEKDILAIYFQKTATYTFKLPLLGGAMLAGASEIDMAPLETYAMESGILYQIRDDILGVFGNEAETGKDTKSDLAEGKKTLLITAAYRQANEGQRLRLNQLVGKKDLSPEEAQEARTILIDTGALDYCKDICEQKATVAKESLAKLKNKEPFVIDLLTGLVDYLIVRSV
jgi:geranylgeranyl diphosphate synthase type I